MTDLLPAVGLGLRRELMPTLLEAIPSPIGFLEVAPENWVDLGGPRMRQFRQLAERVPLACHGLSLSLGGQAPLDEVFLQKVRRFLDAFNIPLYSEHLSYCADDGHLYDLLPLPFTDEAVRHVAARIRRVQDILGRRMAIENVSAYVQTPLNTLSEAEFVRAVVAEADCWLHLDVNNVYVNSINHGFDARAYVRSLPAERIVYIHVAGHYVEAPGLLIDTHGSDVIDPVWALLDDTYACIGVRPTLLERDFNIPPLAELLPEVQRIADLQAQHQPVRHQHVCG
jgi:uncharacterized protein (UPF0276 family)